MKVGIVCDTAYSRHHLFMSYYNSVSNLYGKPQLVTNIHNLEGLELLFIGDDHYQVHKEIWQQPGFIEYCNKHSIKVAALTNERILNSFFSWNKDSLLKLKEFDQLYHYANDVDDCDMLGLKLNRTAPSKSFKAQFIRPEVKKDKALWLGRTDCKSYDERKDVINILKKTIELDVIESTIPKWSDYVAKISEYRFILSPIGNGNFFPMRVYEALAVGSIPIHQVRENTLDLYDIEKGFDDCIFFTSPNELKDKIENCTLQKSHNVIWMEDNLQIMLKLDNLL